MNKGYYCRRKQRAVLEKALYCVKIIKFSFRGFYVNSFGDKQPCEQKTEKSDNRADKRNPDEFAADEIVIIIINNQGQKHKRSLSNTRAYASEG